MIPRTILLSALLLLALFASPSQAQCNTNPNATAVYTLTLVNILTQANFPVVPASGLVFSPPLVISHANRATFFLLRGMASNPVRILAEQGDNGPLRMLARSLRPSGLVRSAVNFRVPTMPGTAATARIRVDCSRPFITFITMLAPSPDWIVAASRENMLLPNGMFRRLDSGPLIPYDAGTDSGGDFTPASDLSLDIPTEPQQNIAPLAEDETDVFGGAAVGRYILRRVA